MLRYLLIGLCYACSPLGAFAQNLIPNGGFEEIGDCIPNLLVPVEVATPWYPTPVDSAGTLYVGDPDLFNPLCPNRLQATFWDTIFQPFAGTSYAGFIGGFTNNGFFLSEGMGVPLTQKLESGKAYFFSTKVRSKGTGDGFGGLPCPATPPRELNVFAGPLPTRMVVQYNATIDGLIREVKNNEDPVMIDTSAYLNSVNPTDWNLYCDCFVAEGDEEHLSIIGPTGFRPSECTDPNNATGYAKVFYYDFDDISLVEMPTGFTGSTNVCTETGTWINLRNFVPLPMFDKATFRWPNGCTDSIRLLDEPGTYLIEVIMPCKTFLLDLEIGEGPMESCPSMIELPVDTSVNICGNENEALNLRQILGDETGEIQRIDWEDGSMDFTRRIDNSGIYEMKVYTLCEFFPYSLEVNVEDCVTRIFVPNAFSPNNDGVNDALQIFLNEYWEVTSYHWRVYDRWGGLVFSTRDRFEQWNGEVKGQLAPKGVYLWTLEYTILEKGEAVDLVESGTALLIR